MEINFLKCKGGKYMCFVYLTYRNLRRQIVGTLLNVTKKINEQEGIAKAVRGSKGFEYTQTKLYGSEIGA